MKKVLLLIVFIASSLASFAERSNCVHRKHRRLSKGVVSFNIAAKENHTVACHHKKIKRKKLKAKADGVITRNERKRLKENQTKAKVNIYRKSIIELP